MAGFELFSDEKYKDFTTREIATLIAETNPGIGDFSAEDIDEIENEGLQMRQDAPWAGGAGSALASGAQTTMDYIRSGWNSLVGDTADVEEIHERRRYEQETPAQQAFLARYEKETADDEGFLDALGSVAKSIWEEPTGALHMGIGQLPNSAAVMTGMYVGAKGGATLGTGVAPGPGTLGGGAVGGIAGGLLGMFLGNWFVETGATAQEKAAGGFTEEERVETLKEGTIKSGVTSTVDVITLGGSKYLAGIPSRAVETAIAKALTKKGVDPLNDAAVKTFVKTQPGQMREVLEEAATPALEAVNSFKNRATRGLAGMGIETTGEGTGAFLADVASTGEASYSDAILESIMSIPFSAGELRIAKGLTTPGKATANVQSVLGATTVDEAIQNASKAARSLDLSDRATKGILGDTSAGLTDTGTGTGTVDQGLDITNIPMEMRTPAGKAQAAISQITGDPQAGLTQTGTGNLEQFQREMESLTTDRGAGLQQEAISRIVGDTDAGLSGRGGRGGQGGMAGVSQLETLRGDRTQQIQREHAAMLEGELSLQRDAAQRITGDPDAGLADIDLAARREQAAREGVVGDPEAGLTDIGAELPTPTFEKPAAPTVVTEAKEYETPRAKNLAEIRARREAEKTKATPVEEGVEVTPTGGREIKPGAGLAEYRGDVVVNDTPVSIERRQGDISQGKEGEETVLTVNPTGTIPGTKGKDGNPIPVTVDRGAPESQSVMVMDVATDGKFTGHHVMLGFESNLDAAEAFYENTGRSDVSVMSVKTMTQEQFKKWRSLPAKKNRRVSLEKFSLEDTAAVAEARKAEPAKRPAKKEVKPVEKPLTEPAVAEVKEVKEAVKVAKVASTPEVQEGIMNLTMAFGRKEGDIKEVAIEKDSPLGRFNEDFVKGTLGKRAVMLDGDKLGFNGAILRSNPDIVYLSKQAKKPHLVVVGHELLHTMKQQQPILYRDLLVALDPLFKDYTPYKTALNNRRKQVGMTGLSDAAIKEEVVADLMGESFTKKEFWKILHMESSSMFERVVTAIQNYLNALMNRLRGTGVVSGEFFSDLELAQKHSAEAMVKFINTRKEATPLSQIEATEQVIVEETGDVIEISEPVSLQLRDYQGRIKGLELLRKCIGV